MGDSRDDSGLEGAADDARVGERQQEFTRRVLLRAGWIVPIVSTVNIPSASAQSPTPREHLDHTDHNDLPHSDHSDVAHTDTGTPHEDAAPHTDTPHSDHADTPHQDHQDHLDAHADSHVDSHVDVHDDVHGDSTPPHTDVPHVDANSRGGA